MPNFLTRDLEIMFEKLVEDFEASCVISREATTSYPDAKAMQRSNDVFYRPQNFRFSIVPGVDITAQADTDLIQRQVPTVFRTPDNARYSINILENRDPLVMERAGSAMGQHLAAQIDANLYATVAQQASIVVRKVGLLTWDDVGRAEAQLISRGGDSLGGRKLFMNPFDYAEITRDLGNRAYLGDVSKDAYSRSKVPDLATFKTFRTDNLSNLIAVGTVTGTTVTANSAFVPSAMTGDLPTDNRRMTLGISGVNIANTKNGDAFTIAGVNAVHNIDKSDTGQPMTFRIISGGGTASPVITPAIIAVGPYRNVSAQAAATAAITFLNTVTRGVNAFWSEGAVALDFGSTQWESDSGVKVMTATTKQGVPIAMGYSQGLMNGLLQVRAITRYATTVLDPERCGIIIGSQT